jgi:AI-2 transport protein TqsA
MTANVEEYNKQFTKLTTNSVDLLKTFGIDANELPGMLQQSARGFATGLISGIMSVLSNGLLVVIFMIFMLAGKSSPAAAPGSFREQVERGIKQYILTKVLVSATTGILVGLTLQLLGVELAMVFGLLAFLLNFIPSIGSVVSTLLPLPVVLLSPSLSVTEMVLAIAIPGGIQFAVGSVIEPRIMGRSLDLHPVVVLLGLIFFGMIWGIIGMILATPIVAVTRIVLERITLTAPVGRLLAGKLEPG